MIHALIENMTLFDWLLSIAVLIFTSSGIAILLQIGKDTDDDE